MVMGRPSDGSRTHTRPVFAGIVGKSFAGGASGLCRALRFRSGRARTARPPPDLRHRQGRRRQVDGRHRARAARGALGAAHDRRRARQPGPASGGRSRRTGETFEEVELADGLFTISIDPEPAMEEYLRVKTGAVGQALGASRLFQAFAMATPGMRELLSDRQGLGARPVRRRHTGGADAYDLVIVDSPAAGHGVGILRTPRTFAEIARVGPIAAPGRSASPRTIADPEFTAVRRGDAPPRRCRSTRRCGCAISSAADGLELAAVFVNALLPERFTDAEARRAAAGPTSAVGPARTARSAAALSEHARAAAQREQLARLRDGLGAAVPGVELPFLFGETLGVPELRRARGRHAGQRMTGDGDRRPARRQAGVRVRRLGRRRQDDDLGGDRARNGRPRGEGRGGDDRPGTAPGQRARASRSSRTSRGASTRARLPAGRRSRASCGR